MIIESQGNTYDVLLDPDGDHIVCKRNKKDPLHAYPVDRESRTYARVVDLAEDYEEADADLARWSRTA
jgi:hypothetical protein